MGDGGWLSVLWEYTSGVVYLLGNNRTARASPNPPPPHSASNPLDIDRYGERSACRQYSQYVSMGQSEKGWLGPV